MQDFCYTVFLLYSISAMQNICYTEYLLCRFVSVLSEQTRQTHSLSIRKGKDGTILSFPCPGKLYTAVSKFFIAKKSGFTQENRFYPLPKKSEYDIIFKLSNLGELSFAAAPPFTGRKGSGSRIPVSLPDSKSQRRLPLWRIGGYR